MNYSSQLRGWAIDRALELSKQHPEPFTVEELTGVANELADYGYIADTDFNDTVQRLAKLLKEVPEPLEKVRGLITELRILEEDIERQLAVHKAATANDNPAGNA